MRRRISSWPCLGTNRRICIHHHKHLVTRFWSFHSYYIPSFRLHSLLITNHLSPLQGKHHSLPLLLSILLSNLFLQLTGWFSMSMNNKPRIISHSAIKLWLLEWNNKMWLNNYDKKCNQEETPEASRHLMKEGEKETDSTLDWGSGFEKWSLISFPNRNPAVFIHLSHYSLSLSFICFLIHKT